MLPLSAQQLGAQSSKLLFLSKAETGDVDAVAALCKSYSTGLTRVRKDNGMNCLHLAAMNGHLDLVKFLVDVRTRHLHPHLDVNETQTRDNKLTAFTLACKHKRYDVVRYLLSQRTIDPFLSSCHGRDHPFYIAVKNNDAQLVRILVEYDVDCRLNGFDEVAESCYNPSSLYSGTITDDAKFLFPMAAVALESFERRCSHIPYVKYQLVDEKRKLMILYKNFLKLFIVRTEANTGVVELEEHTFKRALKDSQSAAFLAALPLDLGHTDEMHMLGNQLVSTRSSWFCWRYNCLPPADKCFFSVDKKDQEQQPLPFPVAVYMFLNGDHLRDTFDTLVVLRTLFPHTHELRRWWLHRFIPSVLRNDPRLLRSVLSASTQPLEHPLV